MPATSLVAVHTHSSASYDADSLLLANSPRSPHFLPLPFAMWGYPLAKHFLSHARTFLCEVSKLNLHQLLDEHLNDAKNVSVHVSL